MGRRSRSCTRRTASGARPPTPSLAERARAVGLGLVDLGIEPDERVAILAHTRPEWTLANLGITCAWAASVAMYQTSSAAECRHVLEHSEAVAVIVEDAEQLAGVSAGCASTCRLCATWWSWRPWDRWRTPWGWEELLRRGRTRDPAELEARDRRHHGRRRLRAGSIPRHHRPGQGLPPDARELPQRDQPDRAPTGSSTSPRRSSSTSPLAHTFALTIQFIALDMGATIAYWERDRDRLVANVQEVRPTYFPSRSASVREGPHARLDARPRGRPRPGAPVRVGGRRGARGAASRARGTSARPPPPGAPRARRPPRALTRAGALRRAAVAGDHRRRPNRGRGARVLRRHAASP